MSVDPSDSYMRLGDVATGTLQYVNNYDVEITNLFLYITVIAPNGVNFAATDFLITFNGTAINVNWNTENPTTKFNTWPISDITGLESGSWEFTFSPLNDGTPVIDGTWTVSMYLYGDLV